MSRVINKPLGELLLGKGLVTEEQIKKALVKQAEENRPIGEIMVRLGYVREEDVVGALATQYGFPYLPLSQYHIHPRVVETIPVEIAAQNCLIAVDRIGSLLTIAMADPLDEDILKKIKELTKCDIKIFVSSATEIMKAVKEYYKSDKPLKMVERPEDLLNKLDFPNALKLWKDKVSIL
jgi:type IV pilus assembly protein PilB